MTVFFFGGEDSELNGTGTATVDFTAGRFRSNMARCALRARDGSSFWDTGVLGSFTSIWFHARVWMTGVTPGSSTSGTGTNMIKNVVRIIDAAGTPRLGIGWNHTANFSSWFSNDPSQWACHSINGAGTTFTMLTGTRMSGCFTGSPAFPDTLDIQITNYNVTNGGSINVYINNVLVFSASNITLFTDSASAISGIRLCGGWAGTDIQIIPFYYSEVIVSDTDTRGLSLATLVPAADGNTHNFDIGGVTNINESPLNDLTLNASGTPGQIQQYTFTGMPSGNYAIGGVGVSARARAGAGGPSKLAFGTRTGGADNWGSDVTLPVGFDRVQSFFPVKPGTSTPYTQAELQAVGANIGMRSAA